MRTHGLSSQWTQHDETQQEYSDPVACWRVDYIGKGGKHLGTVEAPDEKSAIAEAMKTFHITLARQFKIMVTHIEEKKSRS